MNKHMRRDQERKAADCSPRENPYTKHLNPRAAQLISLELQWSACFPSFQCPHERFLKGWLNRQPVDLVLAAIEQTSQSGEKFQDGDHAGRVVSTLLRGTVTYS